jgi:uncharacterized protein (DUF1330 family)
MTAYVIAESEHLDTPEVHRYRQLTQESVARYGGRYLARGAMPEPLEGGWPDTHRMVVIEFPSVEQARGWYASPEYTRARATRSDLSGRRLLLVAGTDAVTPA